MKKRILITGSGGSIATHLIAHIMTNTVWEVLGIDSFRHKGWTDRTIEVCKNHPDWLDRITIFTHDLVAPLSPILKGALGRVDYIINMASLSDVEASIHDPVPFIKNNVDLTLTMLEYAREARPDVFIQISTDEVYGPTETKEHKGVKEWSPILPSNPYAASKACQEAIAISYWRTYDVPLIITNTMNNFGEMQQHSKYPVMIQKALAKGDKVIVHGTKHEDGTVEFGSRSYIHSRNFSDALLFIIENLPPHKHVPDSVDIPDRYNIAGDRQLDNLELAQLIAKLMGKRDVQYEVVNVHTLRPGHDRCYHLDAQKIADLGWVPPVSFEESMKNTIDWQTSHPEWLT